MEVHDAQDRIEGSRRNLAAKLTELRKREARVREAIAPVRHLANPWLRLGLAVVVGYRLGRRAPAGPPGVAIAAHEPSFVHGLVRAGVMAVATAALRQLADEVIGRLRHDPPGDA